jgi:hypothetical protein
MRPETLLFRLGLCCIPALVVLAGCGGEFDDMGSAGFDASASEFGEDGGGVGAGDGGKASCDPGEVSDTRVVEGGIECAAGQREEALTCATDGSGFQWQPLEDFDGSQRECEPGAIETRGEGCDEETRTCAANTCRWGPFEWVNECAVEQIVFVNFGGVTLDDCGPGQCEDPQADTSWMVGDPYGGADASWTFEPFARGQDAQDEILNKLNGYYARYFIRFVQERPSSGDYTMAVVTDTHFLPNHGVCPLDCNNETEQICLVNNITDNSVDTIARFTAHELGHSFGLHHVTNSADIMFWDSSGSSFTQAILEPESSCGLMMGDVQDAPAILANNIGLRAEENVGGACYVDGAAGSCIDVVADSCTGTLITGACPGPADIRCCMP